MIDKERIETAVLTEALAFAGTGPGTTLAQLSLDLLWTMYERITPDTPREMVRADIVRRLIELRTPPDTWHYGTLADFMTDADWTVVSGAGTITKGSTAHFAYTEDIGPTGAIDLHWLCPADYVVEIIELSAYLSDQDAGITIAADVVNDETSDRRLNYQLFSAVLDTSAVFMREDIGAQGTYGLPAMVPGSYLKILGGAEMDPSSILDLTGLIRWHRLPTWVGR